MRKTTTMGEPPQAAESALRRGASIAGALMGLALLVPWGRPEGFAWDVADERSHAGYVVIPILGWLLLLVARYPRTLTQRTRAAVVAGVSFAAGAVAYDLLTTRGSLHSSYDGLQELPVQVFWFLVAALVLAPALDIAHHARRGTRWLAVTAMAGWLFVPAMLFVPLDGGDLGDSFLGVLLRRGLREDMVVALLVAAPVFLVAFVAFLSALRRFAFPEPGDVRRLRSRFAAYFVTLYVGVPIVLLNLVILFDRPGRTFIPGALILTGLPLALAFGGGHLLLAIANAVQGIRVGLRGTPAEKRRAQQVLGGVLALVIAWVGLEIAERHGHGGEGGLRRFTEFVSENVLDTVQGAEVPADVMGGYSEFDLRASRGSFEGRDLEVRAMSMELGGGTEATFATTVVVAGRAVRFAEIQSVSPWDFDVIVDPKDDPAPRLSAFVVRTSEALLRGACPEMLEEADLAGLPSEVRGFFPVSPPPDAPCAPGIEHAPVRRTLEDGGETPTRLTLGRYVIATKDEQGWVVLGGRLYATGNDIWIGRAETLGDDLATASGPGTSATPDRSAAP